MDKVVTLIMSLSSNETDLKNLKQTLQKSEEVLYKSQHLDEAIGQLDFVVFSMGVTFLLYVLVCFFLFWCAISSYESS